MAIEIPGYKLLKTLGRGGMATVYLAEQKILERRIALKVMSRSLAQDPAFGKRFVREAKIVSQLVHPNIVNVHDVGNYKGLYYLSMQYVDGKDLKAMRGSLSVQQKLQAVRDIAKALDYAGGKGYVHRDIKPENILLDSNDNRAILTDFGIAKAVNNDIAMTQTGTAIGTPHYMSPEQAKGLEVDHRADIYSLGVVFYLLLTGALPYDAESAVAIGIKHITEPVPLLPPALSQLQHIIDKMMAKRVVERYQSASDVVFALDEIDVESLEHTIDLAKQMGQTFTQSDYDSDTAVATSVDGAGVDATIREGGLAFAQSSTERPQEIAQSFTIVYSADDIKEKDHRFIWLIVGLIALAITAGVVLKYYPHKVNLALISVGLPVILPTDHIRGLEIDRPYQVDNPHIIQTDNTQLSHDAHLQVAGLERHINQIQQKFSQDPAFLSDLVLAYRQLIDAYPGHPDAKKALFDALNAAQARAFKLAKNGDEKAAFELASMISVLFPEVKKTQLAYLDSRIEQLLFIHTKMQDINTLMRKRSFTETTINKLLKHYNAIFSIDQNHTQALASRSEFIAKLVDKGEAHYVNKRYQKAHVYSELALQAHAESNMAQAFSQKINYVIKGDKAVSVLLKRAKTASKNVHYYHPRTGSAYSYYLQVLNIDQNNRIAKKGLSFIYNAFKQQVLALIKNEKFVEAKQQIEFAQKSASQSQNIARFASKVLPTIETKIHHSMPTIEKLVLSTLPIDNINGKKNTVLTPSKKIYTLFTYSGLTKNVTQLDIKLYFSAKRILLERASIRLKKKDEKSQFILQSPVDFFSPGDYELMLFEGGKLVHSSRFDIIENALL